MAAIESVSAVSAVSGNVASQQATPSQAQVDKFQSLMQDSGQLNHTDSKPFKGPSHVADLVNAENNTINKMIDSMHTFDSQAPNMSMQQLTAETVRISTEAAMTMFTLNASMGVAQSGKSAIQTLFKNQ